MRIPPDNLFQTRGAPASGEAAFTLIELLVVVGIIAVLAAILIPVFVSSRRQAQRTTCLSNLRQIGSAFTQYTQDYDGVYPALTQFDPVYNTPTFWQEVIKGYMGGHFPICPVRLLDKANADDGTTSGYAMNYALNTEEKAFELTGKEEQVMRVPSLVVAVFDARAGLTGSDYPDIDPRKAEAPLKVTRFTLDSFVEKQAPGALRHEGGANYVFLDGHARWLKPTSLRAVCDGSYPCYRVK